MGKINLEVGTVYKVELSDCCISGNFTSKLIQKETTEKSEGMYGEIKFENGVVLETWWGCRFEKVS